MGFNDDEMIDFGLDDEDTSDGPIGQTKNDERGDFSLGDTGTNIDPDYNFPADDADETTPNPTETGDNPKKIALIGIGMGLVILIICFALYSGYKAYQNKKAQEDIQHNNTYISENYNTAETETDQMSSNAQKLLNGQTESTSVSNESSDGWIKFSNTDELTFEGSAESSFTVTNIEYFAKVVNSQNDKIVKCVLKGNISGLVGTYEVEIPYSNSLSLSVGNILNIRYTYHVANNIVILGEIIFI